MKILASHNLRKCVSKQMRIQVSLSQKLLRTTKVRLIQIYYKAKLRQKNKIYI